MFFQFITFKAMESNKNYTTEEWVSLLLKSYFQLFKKDLIPKSSDIMDSLFKANFYLVSHQYKNEPILVYGNQKVLDRWEMTWEVFVGTPSRLTAEKELQNKRAEMLKIADKQGYFDKYEGIRISSKGKRFWIKDALIFNIYKDASSNLNSKVIGQAALFYHTEDIDDSK